jgi:hypothetical protein
MPAFKLRGLKRILDYAVTAVVTDVTVTSESRTAPSLRSRPSACQWIRSQTRPSMHRHVHLGCRASPTTATSAGQWGSVVEAPRRGGPRTAAACASGWSQCGSPAPACCRVRVSSVLQRWWPTAETLPTRGSRHGAQASGRLGHVISHGIYHTGWYIPPL